MNAPRISSESVFVCVVHFIIANVFNVCSSVKDVKELPDNAVIETGNPVSGSTLWRLPRT